MRKLAITLLATLFITAAYAGDTTNHHQDCSKSSQEALELIQKNIQEDMDKLDRELRVLPDRKAAEKKLGISFDKPIKLRQVGEAVYTSHDKDSQVTMCMMRIDSSDSRLQMIKRDTGQKSLPFAFAVRPYPDHPDYLQVGIIHDPD